MSHSRATCSFHLLKMSHQWLGVFAFALVLLFCGQSQQFVNEIKFHEHGYRNVLVAIGSEVSENDEVITRIRDVFTKGSQRLFTATRQRAYFREVFILLPVTWTQPHNLTLGQLKSGQSFRSANIRVDKPNPVWGDNPYTRQPGGCGEPGEFIHLTPEYLLNINETQYRWGPPEKSLVHEWAHLRWGLFDEYPIEKEGDGHFYQTGKTLNPVRCTEDVRGQPLNRKTFARCKVDRQTLQVEKDCTFYPDLSSKNDVKASQMYMQFIDAVHDFCDDGSLGDPTIIHNRLAPNKQNRMCEGRSAWEVMRQHKDFKDGNNPGLNTTQPPGTAFFLLQKTPPMVVLLLDTSNSMLEPDEIPITMMIQAARYYILDLLDDGTQLGIVTFDSNVMVRMPLTKITGMDSRREMVKYLPKKNETGAATALGPGLRQAVGVLTNDGADNQGAKGAKIVVISDGQQTTQPTAEQVMKDDVLPRDIVVDTIAYSSEADLYLMEMADISGGKSFFISSEFQSTGLFDALNTIGAGDESNPRTAPVTIESSAINVKPSTSSQGSFFIDATIGDNTKMIFAYVTDAEVEVNITKPNGGFIDMNSPDYTNDRALKQIEIDVPSTAEVGEWKYTISTTNETVVMAHILSKAKGGAADPIRVTASFANGAKALGGQATAQLTVYAQMTRGYAPVIGVNVNAIIEGDNTKILVPLQDMGIGSDVTRDDGVYSGTFTRHLINPGGRYNVKITVDNPDNTGKIATSGGGSGGGLTIPRNNTDDVTTKNKTYENVGLMRRIATAGEMLVSPPDDIGEVKDVLPPPRITDLKVAMVLLNESIVTLTWTAVGDDVSKGNDTTYDLRVGTLEAIEKEFDNCLVIILTDPSKLAGVTEIRRINMSSFEQVKSSNQTYYLAIRAIDEAGNKGKISNIISVSTEIPESFAGGETVTFVEDTLADTTTDVTSSFTTVIDSTTSNGVTTEGGANTGSSASTDNVGTTVKEVETATTDTSTPSVDTTTFTTRVDITTGSSVTTVADVTGGDSESTTPRNTDTTTQGGSTSAIVPPAGDITTTPNEVTLPFVGTTTAVKDDTTINGDGNSGSSSGGKTVNVVIVSVVCVIVAIFFVATVIGVCMIKANSKKKKSKDDREPVFGYKYYNKGYDYDF